MGLFSGFDGMSSILRQCWYKVFFDELTAKELDNSVADLGEGPRGPGPPLFVEYLQKIYKKVTEMSIQKPF